MFLPDLLRGKRILVLCGKGNNGGDGFVVARHLKSKGARPRVLLVGLRAEVKGDAAQALGRWRGKVEEIRDEGDMAVVARALGEAEIVVDALLGTGVTGPARGVVAQVIERLNNSSGRAGLPVVALDLPSGLGSDGGALLGPSVRATVTATFAGLKRSLLVYPAAGLAGRVTVVPIGVPQAGQREPGQATDSPRGSRWITTFRNDPMHAPTRNAPETARMTTPAPPSAVI